MTALPNGFTSFVSPIKYLLDGLNIFSQYGVAVSASRGIINAPAIKQPFSQSWPDAHGEVVDTSAVFYEPKEFSLDCWMIGTSSLDITQKLNTFYAALRKPGLRRLYLFLDANNPLVFQVYLKGEIDITKKWSIDKMMHCDFKITFREPEPLKIILKGTVGLYQSIGITLSCTKPVNIRWGNYIRDNNSGPGQNADSLDVVGGGMSFSQYYNGIDIATAYPIITGAVESITYLYLTGLTKIWDKLL